jgi:CheY-like chemotaxis protein
MEKLLVVEDSKYLNLAMRRILTEAGFNVVGAMSGEEALQQVRNVHPDLIILDMMLPGLGGEVVLRTLKDDPRMAGIPVLVVSSLSQTNAEKLKNDGAIAYIEKSKLDLERSDNLVRLVTAALRKATKQGELVGQN